jgi:uncharacterized protein YqeY
VVVAVIEKMLKQRKDSITQYEAAQRQDLADAEKFEAGVLSGYMPQGLSAAEVEAIVAAAVAESGAKGPADMGKVIALVKPQVAGRADMGEKVIVNIKTFMDGHKPPDRVLPSML